MKMPRLASMLPETFYHATMVVGHNSLDAHYYQRTISAIRPVQQVTIVGSFSEDSPVLHYFPASSSAAASVLPQDARHDRQLPVLGVATQEALSKARVAVVGLGGLGSFVALELAYLGVGHLILIDPDRIELSNLNRLIGAGPDDVGRYKVDVFRDLVERLAPEVEVTAVAAPLLDSAALHHAKAADLLLGCVDTHGARLSLNHLSIRYLIPLIDAGTGARLGTDSVAAKLGGQVQVVAPGVGCLECRGFIHPQRAAYDLAPPELQEYERDHGYGTEEAQALELYSSMVSWRQCRLRKPCGLSRRRRHGRPSIRSWSFTTHKLSGRSQQLFATRLSARPAAPPGLPGSLISHLCKPPFRLRRRHGLLSQERH